MKLPFANFCGKSIFTGFLKIEAILYAIIHASKE